MFKFKHICSKIAIFFTRFPHILCFWRYVLHCHVYPFNVYFSYSCFHNFLSFNLCTFLIFFFFCLFEHYKHTANFITFLISESVSIDGFFCWLLHAFFTDWILRFWMVFFFSQVVKDLKISLIFLRFDFKFFREVL